MAEPTEDAMIRVVLADDHAIVREGLKHLIDGQSDMRVVGEADDGNRACDVVVELRPDVVVMDVSMPTMGGVEATERIHRDLPSVKIIALTVHEEPVYLNRLFRAGAVGYVLKRAASDELVRAIRTVSSGKTYIDPTLSATLVEQYLDPPGPDGPQDASLSERERQVITQIARGFTNKQIAADLDLSIKTVESYKARVAEKLGLRSRVDIVRYAIRHNWLQQE